MQPFSGKQSDAGRRTHHPETVWHAASRESALQQLTSNEETGLSSDDAELRANTFGPNALRERPPPTFWARLLAQVADVTVLALIAAAIIATVIAVLQGEESSAFERYGDAVAIMAIVILNALLGLTTEKRAERALSALSRMTRPIAHVLRDREVQDLAVAGLVPGDVILVRQGDQVPADARLLEARNLEVNESMLTGESLPVSKQTDPIAEDTALAERSNLIFMGTEVSRGRAKAVVVHTGMQTELGAIAHLLDSVDSDPTPLQRYLNRFGKQIVGVCVGVSLVVFLAGMLQGLQSLRELFLTAVSLAVAAIPEGLPAITTIVLALGTQRMARRHALVRRLPAVEGLGSAQIICTDKTGTLTQNVMTARRAYAAGRLYEIGGDPHARKGSFVVVGGEAPGDTAMRRKVELSTLDQEPIGTLLALSAHVPDVVIKGDEEGGKDLAVVGNPTNAALRVMAVKGGRPLMPQAKVVHELPFSSTRKLATLVIEHGNRPFAIVSGAPEVVLNLSSRQLRPMEADSSQSPADVLDVRVTTEAPLAAEDRGELIRVAEDWGRDGLRVLALGYKTEQTADPSGWEQDVVFAGLVGIVDPPRREAGQAIAEAQAAGVKTMMITGDQRTTARAIARELNLASHNALTLSGPEIDRMDQEELERIAPDLRVVARATPLHKLRIVEALKARKLVCAMTGDGVNDAPAVKAAAIGVAMGQAGTEVTKQSADLVLADDNYATIVAAVEEGRSIFSNIRKFIYFLLSSNVGIVLTVFAASLMNWAPPLAPIQILWVNLITNGLPALALGIEPKEPNLMQVPPRGPDEPILNAADYLRMLLIGGLMAVLALGVFWIILQTSSAQGLGHRLAQTGCFVVLSLSPMFHAFNCRSRLHSNFRLGWFSNPPLWGAVLIGIILIAAAVYTPGLSVMFRTEPLWGRPLALAIIASVVPLLVVEGYKLVCRMVIATEVVTRETAS